ncbi:MAG: sensor histidine kinase KdpD [Candidatus Eremiobacteraeota bacterium]|nr:sensor histidine kinase KdpD [Candidatus Eremiobacteraeota bacterium]
MTVARGKLRIFLGYAPGVGKGEALLRAGVKQREAGRRVQFESIPGELDLDACLRLRPEVVLLTQLARANPPGSRHPRRYQDAEELLAAGIDVFASLEVQQVESLRDEVARLTGLPVREAVPDAWLKSADSLQLIDLPVEELDQPGPGLPALRELALRFAANRVEEQGSVRERLLVAVGPSPLSERLIRQACRLADALNAEWRAVSVEGVEALTPDARERVAAHLRLASSLGAFTEQVAGSDVAARLIEYAQEHKITQIVAGKGPRRGWWARLTPDLVDQLIATSGSIHISVISAESPAEAPPVDRPTAPISAYAWSTLGVLVLSLINALLSRYLAPTNLVMIYLALVCAIAFRLGRGPAFWACTLSLAAFDFYFVPPYYTFAVQDGEYVVTFIALLLVSLVISSLTARAREQALSARLREGQTIALLDLSRDFSSSQSLDEVRQSLEKHAQLRIDPKAEVRMAAEDPSEAERWAWQKGVPAGRGTDTLPESEVTCLPVVSRPGPTLAVLILHRHEGLQLSEQELLESFLLQAAVALERLGLAHKASQAEVLAATERLQSALINSVSHDLRIPLVSIMGALQAVRDEHEMPLEADDRKALVENALGEAHRLNRIVGNLLQMSQLDAGFLRITGQPQDVQDLLSIVPIANLRLPEELPLVHCDFLLTQQVLFNLLDNARKYAPNLPFEVAAEDQGDFVMISVHDQGPGVAEAERDKVFERFYRAKNSPAESGSGLGLSICQGLIEAQGGRIWLDAGVERGARICFTLPVARP